MKHTNLFLTCHNLPPIHVFINIINNGLVFYKKEGDKLELQTPETIKLLGSTKILIDKTKNGENLNFLSNII